MSLAVQSQYIVNRTGYGTASVVHYLIMNSIHPDYRINAVQATGTPCLYFRKYTIGDGTNRLSRHTITQVLLHPVTYLTCAVSQSIKSDDAVCNTFRKPDLEKFYLDTFVGAHVDGIIYTFLPSFPRLVEQISSSTPTVIIGEKLDDLSICSIELSNVNAGAMLAEHLYQLGHRKLVFISTPFNQLTLAREQRLEGIRKQLELHGVTDGLEVLVADRQAEADSQDDGLPYEYSVGRQLTAELIRRESMATALIGVNDMTALGILSELAAQGLRVPRDFSVCGFDNIFSSSITTPGLTTIDHHLRTRCQAAVDMVITQSTPSRIPTPFVNKIEYTPQLIVRGSAGQSPTHRSSEKI